MFITIIIIILGACISIVWSMYYNTITMLRTYGSVNGYYWAYYWAMASIERWLLMSKIKYPTYAWEWGFKWDNSIWAPSNTFSWDFRKLTQWKNSLMRSVNSKTKKIEWTIDTKTLRSISFEKYNDNSPYKFSTWSLSGTYWINEWLQFTWNIVARTPNIWEIRNNRWESSDFNRFFSLKKTWYIVRWLKTTDAYWQARESPLYEREDPELVPYDREWEKDYQLTWEFNFTKDACNPRPAYSWDLNDDKYPNYGC